MGLFAANANDNDNDSPRHEVDCRYGRRQGVKESRLSSETGENDNDRIGVALTKGLCT